MFANVVTSSPSIQEKTFTKLSSTSADKWIVARPHVGLFSAFGRYPDLPPTIIHKPGDPVPEVGRVVVYTPAMLSSSLPVSRTPSGGSYGQTRFLLMFTLESIEGLERPWYCDIAVCSSIDTYVSDPPCRRFRASLYYTLRPRGKKNCRAMEATTFTSQEL